MLIELKNKGGKKIPLGGKICEEDITLVPKLQKMTITENGTYPVPDGYAGNGEITVAVANAGGGGGGSSGGECTGTHVIEVEKLPEEGEEGAFYNLATFTVALRMYNGLVIYDDYLAVQGIGNANCYTSQTLPETGNIYDVCYVVQENEIYIFADSWYVLPIILKSEYETIGMVTDKSQMTDDGFYALTATKQYTYTDGQYRLLVKKGDLQFTSNGDGTCIVSGIEDYHDAEINIPEISPDGDIVTAIKSSAFNGCLFKSISIPGSMASIGISAFDNCYALRDIVLPENTITEISALMFSQCYSLYDISIPHGVTSIENSAFQMCSRLKNITLPESVASINYQAFINCVSMSSITFPSSITNIGYNVFGGCVSLTGINFKGTVEQWNAITKDSAWAGNAPVTKVICSDGEVTL